MRDVNAHLIWTANACALFKKTLNLSFFVWLPDDFPHKTVRVGKEAVRATRCRIGRRFDEIGARVTRRAENRFDFGLRCDAMFERESAEAARDAQIENARNFDDFGARHQSQMRAAQNKRSRARRFAFERPTQTIAIKSDGAR